MPRRSVDEMTVSTLNRVVRDIEANKQKPGLVRVGGVGGLALNVRKREYASGTALSASWVLRRTFEGKRRDFALGPWPEISLAQARERGRVMLDKLWQGIDPAEERRREVAAKVISPTVRKAALAYFDRQIRGKINARDEAKWLNDLESFVFPFIGDLTVDKVETSHVMQIVDQPHTKYGTSEEKRLWESVPERASRMLKKIEVILAAEARLGHRDANNPAAWKDHLNHLLPKPSTIKTPIRQAALPYEQLPQFVLALRSRMPSPSSQALEYLILTASRSGEVRGARWSEIDLERGLWTIPESRMKAGREHRVALPKAAIDLLRNTQRIASTDLIWPGQGMNKPMSDATLAALVKKMHLAETKVGNVGWIDPKTGRPAVPHGFRSTFRDWVAETTEYPSEMAEIALAHEVGTSVERAYRRGDMLERRRAMMEDWANFIAPIGK